MVEKTTTYYSDSGSEYKHTIVEDKQGKVVFHSWKRNSKPLDHAVYMSNARYLEIDKKLREIKGKNRQFSKLVKILEEESTFDKMGGTVLFTIGVDNAKKSTEIKKIDMPYSEDNKDYDKSASSETTAIDAEIDQNFGNGN